MKATLKEVRDTVRDEIKTALNENAFDTRRPSQPTPETFGQFCEAFDRAFTKLNLKQLSGKAMNLHESNIVNFSLDKMWVNVDREMTGFTGAPPPVFKEGREFWAYFGPELQDGLVSMIEGAMPGVKLAKGNAANIAKSVLDALRAGG